MSSTEQILNECLQCSLCVERCEFLQQFCESPVELAEQFTKGLSEDDAYIPYLCTMCGLCKEVCPEDFNCGGMCLEAREMLVSKGLGPLPAHEAVVKEQQRVRSDSFRISFPDPATGRCEQIFLPGCHLSEYSPELVVATYDWLRDKFPHTGFMLRCCGAPTRALGKPDGLAEMAGELLEEIKSLGVKEIIVACPNCCRTIKSYAGQIKVRTVYEVMAGHGSVTAAQNGRQVFALHDPCAGRLDTNTHKSVRELLQSLGFTLEEFKNHGTETTCCGMGGMVGYVSFDMSDAVKANRLAETSSDIVTYCASCREAFAGQRPVLHILDLIFNSNWERDKTKAPNSKDRQHDNTVFLKKLLTEKYALKK